MSLLIRDAMAASSGAQAQHEGSFSFMFMMVAIFVLFYFMLIRPQNKRAKEHQDLLSKLQKGDEIITSGGLLAKIKTLDDQYMTVSPADGVEFKVQKSSVTHVLPKGTMKSL